MTGARLGALLAGLALLGAGCLLPKPPPLIGVPISRPPSSISLNAGTSTASDKKQPDLPCIAFQHRQGFENWLNAYEKGRDDLAVNLALNAKLPRWPSAKFVENLRKSLQGYVAPGFLCALDEKGRRVAWTLDTTDPATGECRELFYVSINDRGTISEVKARGRSADCAKLCKPRLQSPQTFLWQCDVRQTDKKTTWAEVYMDRETGAVRVGDCWQDALGIPAGCTAP